MTDAGNKLCYAPAREIPHPAHPWTDIDTTADRPTLVTRRCDGWAAVTPGFLGAARAAPGTRPATTVSVRGDDPPVDL